MIACIIISYYPQPYKLLKLVECCLEQGGVPIVINNESTTALSHPSYKCHLIQNPKNIGIASAQNAGVRLANKIGSSHLIFFDQDSFPSSNCLNDLRDTFDSLEATGKKPAAVGPQIVDATDGIAMPFVQFGVCGVKKVRRQKIAGAVPADFLIASGMLTSLERFHEIGNWEDGLFIDNVDFEWCFRARAKGFQCYGVPAANLEHSIGDDSTRLKIGGRTARIAKHSPTRQYYIMRNRIHMYKRRYVPLSWKVQDLPRALFKSAYFSILVKPRWQNAKAMALGLWDGLTGIYGPIDPRPRNSSPATNQ